MHGIEIFNSLVLVQVVWRRVAVEKLVGTVKWFDNAKGFGFIVNEAGEDVFVHYRSIAGDGYKTLTEAEQVEYTQTESDRGWQATEVIRLG